MLCFQRSSFEIHTYLFSSFNTICSLLFPSIKKNSLPPSITFEQSEKNTSQLFSRRLNNPDEEKIRKRVYTKRNYNTRHSFPLPGLPFTFPPRFKLSKSNCLILIPQDVIIRGTVNECVLQPGGGGGGGGSGGG